MSGKSKEQRGKALFNGLPRGVRGPHLDREGPCNDPACRKCDPVRARLRQWAERRMDHEVRRRLIR